MRLSQRLGFAVALFFVTAGAALGQAWEFNTPTAVGVPPAGWENASQNITTPPPNYQVTTFGSIGALRIETAANTNQRPKVRTSTTYTTGVYTWHVYVPSLQPGGQCSLGAFLYSDQSGRTLRDRELDFEIAYGTAADRAANNIPADALTCYMTVQRDDSTNTPFSSVIFRPANAQDHIRPGFWYTLTLDVRNGAGDKYTVNWYIQQDGGTRLQGRPAMTVGYGAGRRPTTFRIYCSLENLAFTGEHLPTVNQHVWFDRVERTN